MSFPDTWGKSINQHIIQVRILTQLLELLDLLLREPCIVFVVEALILFLVVQGLFGLHVLVILFGGCGLLVIVFVTAFVGFDVANDINVCSIDVLENSHACINSAANCSVNTDYLNSVSWFNIVNEILISAHVKSLWSLSLWHRLWGLLHLDMLLVREHAEIVHHLKGESAITVLANFWLSYFSALDELAFFFLALSALEGGLLHLWGGVRGSDDDTFQSDQLVDVRRVKLPDLVNLPEIEWSHLNDRLILILIHAFLKI